ncbi:MAG: hypothetical protein ACKO7W_09280, partial [Elainella sp.]
RPFSGIAPFAHEVKPETQFVLLSDSGSLEIPDGFKDVFLYNPGEGLLSAVNQQGFAPELVYRFRDPMSKLGISLYRLERTPPKNSQK